MGEIGNFVNGGCTDIMTKTSITWACLAVAAGLVSGCAISPLSVSTERAQAISERDARLRSLEAQRRKAQRGCERAEAGQCQRAEILNHEMDAFLVRPW